MKHNIVFLLLLLSANIQSKIDRQKVLLRNNPHITAIDSLASLSVGNGHFAVTVDVTGLQTFPSAYRNGIPLGTMSDWGWHSFPNRKDFSALETLRDYDFGRGRKEPYAVQIKEEGRQREATEYFRINPHRLHLGNVGFDIPQKDLQEIHDIDQTLSLWDGMIRSRFTYKDASYEVQTACLPDADALYAEVRGERPLPILLSFPYPTGQHSDDASRWDEQSLHTSTLVSAGKHSVVISRVLDNTIYYVRVRWEGDAEFEQTALHTFRLKPSKGDFTFTSEFFKEKGRMSATSMRRARSSVNDFWHKYWNEGGFVDFSRCTDPRASELERRVILSQYLLAIQDAGNTPPQETGLTYNSWYGKFHLEMALWHQAQFALWGHPECLERSLQWYLTAADKARQIAQRQGFKGLRWMKMTDPSGSEAPSSVGSFLIWQQPHLIYLAELLRRAEVAKGERKTSSIKKFSRLVHETAEFMADYAEFDEANNRYVLRGCIPAQETLSAATTVNPPFELSYWHFALALAQQWRVREGKERMQRWDDILTRLATLASRDSLYLAAESAPDTYQALHLHSDHPAVLGAFGVIPGNNRLIDKTIMHNTLCWVWNNWNWDKTWGWDFPMTAMCAARLGNSRRAVDALMFPLRTNTYLANGHNYQDQRLRIYLPGNGGLLMAVALMCAGWDNSEARNPGFPNDGTWDVQWEGILSLP